MFLNINLGPIYFRIINGSSEFLSVHNYIFVNKFLGLCYKLKFSPLMPFR